LEENLKQAIKIISSSMAKIAYSNSTLIQKTLSAEDLKKILKNERMTKIVDKYPNEFTSVNKKQLISNSIGFFRTLIKIAEGKGIEVDEYREALESPKVTKYDQFIVKLASEINNSMSVNGEKARKFYQDYLEKHVDENDVYRVYQSLKRTAIEKGTGEFGTFKRSKVALEAYSRVQRMQSNSFHNYQALKVFNNMQLSLFKKNLDVNFELQSANKVFFLPFDEGDSLQDLVKKRNKSLVSFKFVDQKFADYKVESEQELTILFHPISL